MEKKTGKKLIMGGIALLAAGGLLFDRMEGTWSKVPRT